MHVWSMTVWSDAFRIRKFWYDVSRKEGSLLMNTGNVKAYVEFSYSSTRESHNIDLEKVMRLLQKMVSVSY